MTENKEVKNRWKENLRELFNGEEREIGTRREAEESEAEMSDEITEDEEVRRTIWKLKSGKASGVCGIQGELLKTGSEEQLTQNSNATFLPSQVSSGIQY